MIPAGMSLSSTIKLAPTSSLCKIINLVFLLLTIIIPLAFLLSTIIIPLASLPSLIIALLIGLVLLSFTFKEKLLNGAVRVNALVFGENPLTIIIKSSPDFVIFPAVSPSSFNWFVMNALAWLSPLLSFGSSPKELMAKIVI